MAFTPIDIAKLAMKYKYLPQKELTDLLFSINIMVWFMILVIFVNMSFFDSNEIIDAFADGGLFAMIVLSLGYLVYLIMKFRRMKEDFKIIKEGISNFS